jgi:NAD(P)-dependent dehydrogenase (short-subunit alcohol dehydrogenase family)
MNIIITGGSRGIGKETAILMAQDKDNQLLVTGRDEKALKTIATGCSHQNLSYLRMDLSTIEKDVKAARENIFNRFSKVDILINCAGSLTVRDFLEIRNDEAREMMETNFFGPASLVRLVAPLMPSGSHIVNITSMGGFQGSTKFRGLSFYSASKAALACLTECLATEFTDLGISVNCLALGSVNTEMFRMAFPGRNAHVEPEEAARFISCFAREGNRFMNGKIIPVALGNP